MRFDGKVGLITGGGSGIGRATAIGFGKRGGKVAVADVNGAHAEQVANEITSGGGAATAITADVSRPEEISAMIGRTVEVFGRVDLLHNNAFCVPASLQKGRLARVADIDQ